MITLFLNRCFYILRGNKVQKKPKETEKANKNIGFMRTLIESSKSFDIDYPEFFRFQKGMENEKRYTKKDGIFVSKHSGDDEVLVMFSGGIELSGSDVLGRKFNYLRHALFWSDLCIGSVWQKVTKDRQYELAGAGYDFVFTENSTVQDEKSRLTPISGISRTAVINAKGIVLGIIFLELRKEDNDEELIEDLQNRITEAKASGAEYIISMFRYKASAAGKFNEISKIAAQSGADYIIGDSGVIAGEKCYDRIYGVNKKVPRVHTLGAFGTGGFAYKKDSIVLRVKFKRVNGGIELIEESYVPCFTAGKANGISDIVLPVSSKPTDGVIPKSLKNTRRRIGRAFAGLSEIHSFLYLEKLFDLLDIPMPERYNDIGYKYAGKLRLGFDDMVNKGVYFLLPFERSGEKDREEYRKKLTADAKTAVETGAHFIFSPVDLGENIPHIVYEDPFIIYEKIKGRIIRLNSQR